MGKTKKSSANFLVQGSILAIASIVSRIIGLVYRIPMTNIIGNTGNSYYGCAFEIYNIMLIISSYSLPLAVSKLVSAKVAKGQKKAAYQIFKGAFLFALISGTIVALIVFFGADFLTSVLMKTPKSYMALLILAPALIVVAILGVFRGFFQGLGTMMPSAISQILEQIVNAIVSIWAAYVLFDFGSKTGAILGDSKNWGAAWGAAGGTLGTNLGSVAALMFVVFVFVVYMKVYKRMMKRERNVEIDSFGFTMKMLIITIIPVLLSTTIYNVNGIIDQAVFKNIAYLQGYVSGEIDNWYGIFSGKYKLLINVPISIASALAASSVPALTRSYAEHDIVNVRKQIGLATRFIMVVALPSAVGLGVLGGPIVQLLFPNDNAESFELAGIMMALGAIAVVFYALSTLTNGLLQGINRLISPVKNALIALVTHLILLVMLMLVFRMNIYAVVIANAFFGLVMCYLNAKDLNRYCRYRQEVLKTFIIPGICSAIMGVIIFFVYKGLHTLTSSNAISVIVSMVIAIVIYAVTLLLFKGLSEEELQQFPMGGRIATVAKKIHLLR